jgi:hypothetical protein
LALTLESGVVALSGRSFTPFLRDLVELEPNLRVIVSEKDPLAYEQHLLHRNASGLICKQQAGRHNMCYDILACCKGIVYAHQCWTLERKYSSGKVMLRHCMLELEAFISRLIPEQQLSTWPPHDVTEDSPQKFSIPFLKHLGITADSIKAIMPPLRTPTSVRYVNVGLGTTATRSIHTQYCDLASKPACHYYQCCNLHDGNKTGIRLNLETMLTVHWNAQECVNSKLETEECRVDVVIAAFRLALKRTFTSGVDVLGDSPYPYLLQDILDLAPNVSFSMTLRDPTAWAVSRVRDHGNDVICKPRRGQEQRSCYDILSCCNEGDRYVHECWVNERSYSSYGGSLEKCMVGHTNYVKSLVPKERLYQFNLWNQSQDQVKKSLMQQIGRCHKASARTWRCH